MAISLHDLRVEGTGITIEAFGSLGGNASSIVSVGVSSKNIDSVENAIRLLRDPVENPYAVVKVGTGEAFRMRIKEGNNKNTVLGEITSGVDADPDDPILGEKIGRFVRIRGLFKHKSTNSSLMTLLPKFRPAENTYITGYEIQSGGVTTVAIKVGKDGKITTPAGGTASGKNYLIVGAWLV